MTDKPIKATLDSSDDSVKTQKPILIQLDDIPTPTDADVGKVLGVDEDGAYALTEGGGIDIYVNMDSADIVVGEYTDAAGNYITSVEIPLSAVYSDISLTTNLVGNSIQYGNTIIVHYVRTYDGIKYDTKQSIVADYVATADGYNDNLYLTEMSISDVAGASAKIAVTTISIVITE